MTNNDYTKFGLFERTGIAITLMTVVGLTFSMLYMLTLEHGGGGAGFERGMSMLTNAAWVAIAVLMFGRPAMGKIRERRLLQRLKGVF